MQLASSPLVPLSVVCLALSQASAQLVITEVFYDAPSSDAELEWVEIANLGSSSVDLSTWSLGYGGTDYTTGTYQLSGVLAAGEAFVVGGPLSTADNGNPVYDISADFSPNLQNSGSSADAIALFNLAATAITSTSIPIDAVIYGTTNTSGFLDESGSIGTPDVGDTPDGTSLKRLDAGGTWVANQTASPGTVEFLLPPVNLVISEVLYDPSGSDNESEWIELFNADTVSIDLSNWSLGYGGGDYTNGTYQLSGTISPGETFLVGGPLSTADNSNPVYDLALDFASDLQNSSSTGPADAIGLFNLPASLLTSTSIPVDAVIYGVSNTDAFLDETGAVGSVDVGDASSGTSLERIDLAGTWQIQASPTPNSTPLGSATGIDLSSLLPLELVSVSAGTSVTVSVTLDSASDVEFYYSTDLVSWDKVDTTTLPVGSNSVEVTPTLFEETGFVAAQPAP